MRIVRKNRIYVPDGSMPWAKTHAMNPTIDILNNGRLRIYFSSLDAQSVGRIGYIEVNASEPTEVLYVSTKPVLDIGVDGAFDDSGVISSSIKDVEGKKYLYYFGFQKVEKVRFLLFTGLATSMDNGQTFQRVSTTPVLDRTIEDLHVRSLPHVIIENGKWRMWYSGVNRWVDIKGKRMPFGEIKYTESADGISFTKKPQLCLSPYEDEFSLSRAFVFKEDLLYKMIFSRRMKTDIYKLGYAESTDGIQWNRNDDKIVVTDSKEEWDSEMICYSSIVKVNDKTYLFYNGNGFGKTGLGYAEVYTN